MQMPSQIFHEYKGSPMTAFPQFSDADIEDILYRTTADADPVKKGGMLLEASTAARG